MLIALFCRDNSVGSVSRIVSFSPLLMVPFSGNIVLNRKLSGTLWIAVRQSVLSKNIYSAMVCRHVLLNRTCMSTEATISRKAPRETSFTSLGDMFNFCIIILEAFAIPTWGLLVSSCCSFTGSNKGTLKVWIITWLSSSTHSSALVNFFILGFVPSPTLALTERATVQRSPFAELWSLDWAFSFVAPAYGSPGLHCCL